MIALAYLGILVALIGGIWLLVVTFKESIWWGLGSLFLPIVGLVFVIMHWQISKKPFLIYLGGIILCVIGAMGIRSDQASMGMPT